MRQSSLYLTLVAILLSAAGAGYAAQRGDDDDDDDDDSSRANTRSHPRASRLRVNGSVNGLHPGRSTWIRLRVRNRYSHRIKVRSIRARVGNASATCLRSNLRTRRRRPAMVMPPHSTRWVRMRIAMVPNAANGCQGATFPLRFRARATRR